MTSDCPDERHEVILVRRSIVPTLVLVVEECVRVLPGRTESYKRIMLTESQFLMADLFKNVKILTCIFLLGLQFAVPGFAQNYPDESQEPFDLAVNLASFDVVWDTVQKTHWDEKLLAEKWSKAREKYRPQVESSSSVDQVRSIIHSMINDLGQSHFGIIEASALDVVDAKGTDSDNDDQEDQNDAKDDDAKGKAQEDEADDGPDDDATTGLQFRLTKDGVVVSHVAKGSSAEKAGVETGWLVEKIGRHEMGETIEKLQSAAHGPLRVETLAALSLERLASGTSGKSKSFRFVDRNSEIREMSLELESAEGEFVRFGHLPPIRLQSRVETLPGEIGYVWFNAFFNPIKFMPLFRGAIRGDEHRNGVVIDLRNNMGGLGGMTMGIASEFSDRQAALGIMTMRGSEMKFFVNENAEPVACPVAVLVDESSISSAEILSGGLQDLRLARIFGSRTAGLALPSTVTRLPNGDGFQYAIADYHSASGKSLEKEGVVPDEVVELTRQLLLDDPDPVLSRAIAWIASQDQESPKSN